MNVSAPVVATPSGVTTSLDPKAARLEALLKERIVIIDGAMGTMIQQEKLTEADFRHHCLAARSSIKSSMG